MSFYVLYRGDEASRHAAARFADIGELEQSTGFPQEDAVDLSRSIYFSFSIKKVYVFLGL